MEKKKILISELVQMIQFNFDQVFQWLTTLDAKFGYISMAQYIRIIETLDMERGQKDILLNIAFEKMDYGNYETFFSFSHDLNDLYQKIFLLIMIEYVSEYVKKKSLIVWEVIGRYYIEEHFRLCPYDQQLDDIGSEQSSKRKIYKFFVKKNIDLQAKLNFFTQSPTLFEMVMQYFYKRSDTN